MSVAPHVQAGMLTEPELMGIYQSCLMSQMKPMHQAAYAGMLPFESGEKTVARNPSNSERFQLEGAQIVESSEYHNPFIGPARLTVHYSGVGLWRDVNGSGYHPQSSYDLVLDSQYRNGSFQVKAQRLDPKPTWPGHISGEGSIDTTTIVETRKMKLPFYEYKTWPVADHLGVVTNTAIIERPKLLVYPGPDRLPFLNEDTGKPILSSDGKPVEFDVKQYKLCLESHVARAYAIPNDAEVTGRANSVQDSEAADKSIPTLPTAISRLPTRTDNKKLGAH